MIPLRFWTTHVVRYFTLLDCDWLVLLVVDCGFATALYVALRTGYVTRCSHVDSRCYRLPTALTVQRFCPIYTTHLVVTVVDFTVTLPTAVYLRTTGYDLLHY